MADEPLAVVGGDGVHPALVWLEQLSHGFTHRIGSSAFDLANQGEARFSFDKTDDGLFVILADDGIRFPVADPVGDGTAPVMLAVTLPALLLAAQVFPQRAARAFVGINPLVHRLMADGGMVADLVWTPVFTQLGLGKPPSGFIYSPGLGGMALAHQSMRLLRAVTALAVVAAQFPADGGRVAFKHVGNLVL